MKVGDRGYVVMGLDVEEWEVYMIDGKGEPWIKRDGRMGMRANLNYTYLSLDGAVSAAQNARERSIKKLARDLVRLGINSSIKVRLLKSKPKVTA